MRNGACCCCSAAGLLGGGRLSILLRACVCLPAACMYVPLHATTGMIGLPKGFADGQIDGKDPFYFAHAEWVLVGWAMSHWAAAVVEDPS